MIHSGSLSRVRSNNVDTYGYHDPDAPAEVLFWIDVINYARANNENRPNYKLESPPHPDSNSSDRDPFADDPFDDSYAIEN